MDTDHESTSNLTFTLRYWSCIFITDKDELPADDEERGVF